MDALTRRQFDRAMFAKDRTLAIRVGDYASRDIKEASFEYGYIKGDTYKPGGTCAGSGKITFTSIITTFNKLDILHPEIGLLVGNTYQWVKMGEYFINDIEIDRNRNTTTLELMDGMFKLNREYVTDLHFPAEVREVIQEICLKTGIELANDYFGISAMRYHVEQVPEGKKLSFRDMLSAMAQMIGMSCFFNREGKMEIRDLTESNITINADSYFLHGLTKSEIEYQIAGITCKTDKKPLTVGMKTGRSLELDNVFMTQSALNDLYYKLKNLTYYPYNLNYQGHLLLEVGQWVTIQTNKKETFKVPVLSQSFTFKGGLRGRISADSKSGNDTQYSYEGTITKQIKQQDGIEAKIQAQIEAADAAFEAEFKKRKKEIDDGIELAKAKAEEVKQELSETINQRFDSFDNGPLKEAKRKAEEALKNAGASSSLAQEAKQIGLNSIARLEAFKSQTTTTQTALSGDLDALKRTIANDIRPKQEQAESEIAKQVEALVQTKKELAGVKSAQATYEETTTRRLSELTNLANGKASKSELTQTAEQLASKIASAQAGSSRNYFRNSRSRTFTTGDQATYDYRTFIVPDFWKNSDRFKRDYVRISFDMTFPVALANDMPAMVHFSAHPWYAYRNLVFKGGTTERQHFEFTIDLSGAAETYYTNNVFIRFGTNYGFPAGLQVVIENAMLSVSNYYPTYQPAYEDQEERVTAVESNFKQRADSLDAGVSRLTEGLRTKADISALNVTAENIRQSVKSLETDTQNKLNQKLSTAEFDVRASGIRQEILNATKDKADRALVTAEAGKLREELASQVGSGRNLWINSKIAGNPVVETLPAGHITGQKQCYKLTNNQELSFNIEPDFSSRLFRKVTFSAWIKYENVVKGANAWNGFNCFKHYLFLKNSQTGATSSASYLTMAIFEGTSDWKRIVFTYDYSSNKGYDQLKTILRFNLENVRSGTAWITGIQVEFGGVANEYAPALEDVDSLITEAKASFERTAQGLRTDLTAVQYYVNKDGQRQETLQRYAREESAKQATSVRELVTRDFVGKASYQEDVRAIERKFEAITNPQNGLIATQIANYKTAVDGRFTEITSMISGKANQTDFQRVRETSQLYERILGNTENGIADKVARMAMTNQLFQVEVGKAFAEHQNLFLNSTLTKGFLGNNGIINVANATQKEVTSDFISVDPNEKIIFQHWVTLPENGMAWTAWQFFDKNKNPIDNRKPGLNAYKTTVGKQHNINQITVPANAYFVRFSARMYDDGLIKVEKGSAPSDYSVAPNDALEAVKTVQRQLAGSWAIQNINSAGDIISGINLGADGRNRFIGKTFHITGETLIDNAVIKSAMVDKLKTANFESGSVTTTILDAEAVTADKVRFDNAFIRKMLANEAFIDHLTSKQIFATKVESVVSSSTFLEAYQGRIGGFTLGQFDQGGGRWISGVNQFSVGMGNGAGYGVRTAFWANWGNNWNYAGPKAWNVNTDGKMYCRNEVGFYDQVDFSNSSRANFYGNTTFSHSPVFSNGIELGEKDVFGDGWNPKGGRNAVVWWNQVGSGSVKYWMDQKSDRRLKENITDTAVKALDKINRLNMVAFDFIESKKHEEIGLIAQEVETIVPRVVSRDPENPDGYLHIDYAAFVPYLLKAIQELNQKIEKMEKTIA